MNLGFFRIDELGTTFRGKRDFVPAICGRLRGVWTGRPCGPSRSSHKEPGTRAAPSSGKWPRHWVATESHHACRCCGLREHCTDDPAGPAGPALATSGRWAGSRDANAGDGYRQLCLVVRDCESIESPPGRWAVAAPRHRGDVRAFASDLSE